MRLAAVLTGITLVIVLACSTPYWKSPEADDERVFLHDGRQFQKKQIDYLLAKFAEEGMTGVTASKGKISVLKKFKSKCNEVIRSSEFAKLSGASESQAGMLARSFMSPTDKENLEETKKLNTLKSILVQISGIRDAIIVYDKIKATSFKRQMIHSAVVTLWAKEGHVIEQLHAATARQIVKGSFAGMNEDDVLVVDGDTGLTFSSKEESNLDKVIVKNQI
ncbi:MAG: hypothetical protein VX438_09660, partial [Planctomycetota bacterium]|nr:hypothetical protein [Planctomycetota bacterium]